MISLFELFKIKQFKVLVSNLNFSADEFMCQPDVFSKWPNSIVPNMLDFLTSK